MLGQTSHWSGRNVLVTGTYGFLGSAVARELLDRNAHVVGLIRERNSGKSFAREYASGQFHIVQGSTEDSARIYSLLAIHEVSAIFHMVDGFARSGVSGGSNRHIDNTGTAATMRAAALYDSKLPVIVARPSSQLRLVGADPARPHGIARFGELFGPGDSTMSHFVTRTITGLLAGERLVANGDSSNDFVFIRDAAEACLSLAEAVASGSEPLDITFHSGWEFTAEAMAGLLSNAISGQQTILTRDTMPANPLGWQPRQTLSTGISETVAWYRQASSVPASSNGSANSLRKAA